MDGPARFRVALLDGFSLRMTPGVDVGPIDHCLWVTGFIQCMFAAAIIFSSALRGAGDTMSVMRITLASTFGLRLLGVLIVGGWLELGVAAIWVVLSCELMIRGALVCGHFLRGQWKQMQV